VAGEPVAGEPVAGEPVSGTRLGGMEVAWRGFFRQRSCGRLPKPVMDFESGFLRRWQARWL